MKLKKILQIMHAEINKSGVNLELKGGLDTFNRLLNEDESDQSVDAEELVEMAGGAKDQSDCGSQTDYFFIAYQNAGEDDGEPSPITWAQLQQLNRAYTEDGLLAPCCRQRRIDLDLEKPYLIATENGEARPDLPAD